MNRKLISGVLVFPLATTSYNDEIGVYTTFSVVCSINLAGWLHRF